ncbi:hypothetical protein BDF22DRAFT_740404 [Syncephalis plumigaleata]|nr:hypothetical protein BDF22DRAFT_740404 [Syncephalis plumigaleata]
MKLSTFKIAAFVAATTICISNAVEALSTQKQHCLINEIRVKRGKEPFIHDASLTKAAAERALLMAEERIMLASFPGEPSSKERLLKINPHSKLNYISQVPGYGARNDNEIVQRIMNSPTGRKIILGHQLTWALDSLKLQMVLFTGNTFMPPMRSPEDRRQVPAFAELPIAKASKKQQ